MMMAAIMLSTAALAGSMRIEMDDYSRYEVYVDGKKYTTSKRITLKNLNRGRHNIKIYEIGNRGLWGNDSRRLLFSDNIRIDRRETLYFTYDDRRGPQLRGNYYNTNSYGNNGYCPPNDVYNQRQQQREIARQRELARQREIARQRELERRRQVERQRRQRNRNACEPVYRNRNYERY